MAKKISIIIPAYNAQKYIVRCLNSIVNQANDNIEVVIVNDGSTDNTERICREYSSIYNYIKTVSQTNGGVSSARNNGIKNAQGEYILFLDADDFFAENAIEWFLSKTCDDNCLWCGSYNYIKTRNRIEPFYLSEKEYDLESEYIDNIIDFVPNAPWGKLYNRELLVKNDILFPEGIPYAEDTIFLLNYLQYVRYVKTSKKVIYNYNFTDSGSAMWKYYPDYYKYMLRVMAQKKQLCQVKDVTYDEMKDNTKYYNRSLRHYLMNKHSEYLDDVLQAFNVDGVSSQIKNTWYKKNAIEFFKFRLKKRLM